MGKQFDNILAIVNCQDDGDSCFRTAIQVANKFGSNLHVVCLREADENENSGTTNLCDNTNILTLQRIYRPVLDRKLSLRIHIMEVFSRNILLGYIARNRNDLVMVWKSSGLFFPSLMDWIYANWLSRKAGCAVLSLQRDIDFQKVKNIILPVRRSLPAGKLMLALRVAGACKATIHLVGVVDGNGATGKDNFFIRACQLLQYHPNIDVECKMFEGVNLPGTIAKYVGKANADLIIVCASRKALFYGILGLLFSARGSAVSRISVMTIPTELLNIL